MDPVDALTRLGGVAPGRDLRALTSRSQLARAIAGGEVLPLSRQVPSTSLAWRSGLRSGWRE